MKLRLVSALSLLIVPAAAFAAPQASPEAALWAAASQGAAAQLQLYLAQYPSGAYASRARAALAALGSAQAGAPQASAPAATAPPPQPAPSSRPGWLVEVRASHPEREGGTWGFTPWTVDAAPVAVRPMPGHSWSVAAIAASVAGAGHLPALGGAAKWIVRQPGTWAIGCKLRWRKMGPTTASIVVQGAHIVDANVGQQGMMTDGEQVFSGTLDLSPGVYETSWTLQSQPAFSGTGYLKPDASIEILVARPGEALGPPQPGDFVLPR